MKEHIEIVVGAADIFWNFCKNVLADLERCQPEWWEKLLEYDRHSSTEAYQITTHAIRNNPGHQGIEIMDYQACVKALCYVFFDWIMDHYNICSIREKYRSNLKEAIYIRNEAVAHQSALTFERFGDEQLKSRLDCYLNLIEPLKSSFPDDYIKMKDFYNKFVDSKLKINLPISVDELSQEFMCSEKDVLHACVEKDIPILENSKKVGCHDYKVLLKAILPWIGEKQRESNSGLGRLEKSSVCPSQSKELVGLDRYSKRTLYKEQIYQIAGQYHMIIDESIPMDENGRNFLLVTLSPILKTLGIQLLVDGSTLHYLISLANMNIYESDIAKKERLLRLKNSARTGYECLKILKGENELGIAASIDPAEDTSANLISVVKKARQDKSFCFLTQNSQFAEECWELKRPNLIVLKIVNDYSAQINWKINIQPSEYADKKDECIEPAFKVVPFCGQMDQTLIDRPEIKEENSLQITGSAKMVYLSKIVSSGGEGTVFDTDIPGMVAKIYKKSENTKGREKKIQRMTERKPDIPGICWPIDRLQTVDGKFSGYLMRKADGLELATSVFRPLKTGLRGFPEWNRKDLVELGITLCSFFAALHRNNVLVGDVNARNILVKNAQTVYFVDADSFQLEEFPCPVGNPIYTAPEIFEEQRAENGNLNYAGFLRTIRQEQYAIAVLLFQVLLPGKIPFTQDGGVIDRNFTFPFHRNEENAVSVEKAPSGKWRFIWSHLPYEMKDAFYGVFVEGKRYSAEEWTEKLQHYSYLIDQEKSTSELFPSTFKETLAGDGFQTLVCLECGEKFNISNAKYEKLRSGGVTQFRCKLCMDEMRMNQKIEVDITCTKCGRVYHENRRYAAELLEQGRSFLCPECRSGSVAKPERMEIHTRYSPYPWG